MILNEVKTIALQYLRFMIKSNLNGLPFSCKELLGRIFIAIFVR